MEPKFQQRFNIKVDMQEAQCHFVTRVHTYVFDKFIRNQIPEGEHSRITITIITELGGKPKCSVPLATQVGNDFHRNLQALEVLYGELYPPQSGYRAYRPYYSTSYEFYRTQLTNLINEILGQSVGDLGIRWEDGQFIQTGATLLDDRLVNDSLQWLSSSGYESVLTPFTKGLGIFQYSAQRPQLLSDVITDMYEAVEALAKIITQRDDDLSRNRELFIRNIKASSAYKQLLKDYIAYANDFRHSARVEKPKPNLTSKEVESFIYLTGIFIRLAMPSST